MATQTVNPAETQAIRDFTFKNGKPPATAQDWNQIHLKVYGVPAKGFSGGSTQSPTVDPNADLGTIYKQFLANQINQPSYSDQFNQIYNNARQQSGLGQAQQTFQQYMNPANGTTSDAQHQWADTFNAINDAIKSGDYAKASALNDQLSNLGAQSETSSRGFLAGRAASQAALQNAENNFNSLEQVGIQGATADREAQQALLSNLYQAQQAAQQNAMQEAALTGTYNGQETLAGRTAGLDALLKQQQLTGTQPLTNDQIIQLGVQGADKGLDVSGIYNLLQNRSGSVSVPNNNLFGIKMAPWLQQKYGVTQGSAAKDGGYFSQFQSPQDSIKAAQDLLLSPSYANMTPQDAIKKWSNFASLSPAQKAKAYANVNAVPGTDPTKTIGQQPGNIGALVNFIGSHEQPTQWAALTGGGQGDLNSLFAPNPDVLAQRQRIKPFSQDEKLAIAKATNLPIDQIGNNQQEFESKHPGVRDVQDAQQVATIAASTGGLDSLKQVQDQLGSTPADQQKRLAALATPGKPGVRSLDAALTDVVLKYVFIMSGKQVSAQEIGKYDALKPKLGDSPATIQQKLDRFKSMFQTINSALNGSGSSPAPSGGLSLSDLGIGGAGLQVNGKASGGRPPLSSFVK